MSSAIRIITNLSKLLDVNIQNVINKEGLLYDSVSGKWINGDITSVVIPDQSGNSGKFLTTNGLVLSWATVGSVGSGYSGYSGLSGYSGYSGISGYSGSGISGYSGYSGAGISGYSGYSGKSGYSGYSGISGYSGYSGYSGLSGYSGYSGISGYSGYSGISGYSGSGISGYSGYSGLNGAAASSGYSGYSGYSSTSGYSGYSGYSGISGYSGYSGYSGISGYSGYSGYSGISGYSGLAASISLTGDVTTPAMTSGAYAATISNNAVTVGKIQQISAQQFLGRITAGTGNVAVLNFSDINAVGTISSGVWNGSTITVPNGGTGIISLAQGSILYGSGSSTMSTLAITSSANKILGVNAASTSPEYKTISAGSTKISITHSVGSISIDAVEANFALTNIGGTLTVAKGGTGLTSVSGAGALLYGTSTTALASLAAGSSSQILHGGTTPSWASVSLTADVSGILPGANGGTNNAFMQFSGPTTSIKTYALPDSSTTILTTANTITVGQGGTGRATLTSGNVLIGNGASAINSVAPGSDGQVLTASGGAWISTAPSAASSIVIGTTVVGTSTVGSALFVGASNLLQQNNANFFWDNTTNANYLKLGSGTSGGEIRLLEGSGSGTNYVGFKSPLSLSVNNVYTLPTSFPTTGYVLSSTDTGILSWIAASSASSAAWSNVTSGINIDQGQLITRSASSFILGQGTLKFEGSVVTSPSSPTHEIESGAEYHGFAYSQKFIVGNQCLQVANGRNKIIYLAWNNFPGIYTGTTDPLYIGYNSNYIKIAGSNEDDNTTGSPFRGSKAKRIYGFSHPYAGRCIKVRNSGNRDLIIAHNSSFNNQPYIFSTNTAATDPTSTFIKFNNSTYSSITNIYISNTNSSNLNIKYWINNIISSKRITIYDRDSSSNYVVFKVSSISVSSNYSTIGVEFVYSFGSSFSNNLPAIVSYSQHNPLNMDFDEAVYKFDTGLVYSQTEYASFDNSDFTSVQHIYFSYIQQGGSNISNWLNIFLNNTIKIYNLYTPSNYAIFRINSRDFKNDYIDVSVTYLSHNGSFANDSVIGIMYLGVDIYANMRILTPSETDIIMRADDVFTFIYDDEVQRKTNTSLSQAGRWILIGGYEGVLEDPMCVSKVYDDFLGGSESCTSGSIGNTGFSSYTSSGGIVSVTNLWSSDVNNQDLLEKEQGLVHLQTGTSASGASAIYYNARSAYINYPPFSTFPSGDQSTITNVLVGGTAWECIIYIDSIADVTDDYVFVAGMSDQVTTASSSNFVGFVYNRSATPYWQIKTVKSSNSTTNPATIYPDEFYDPITVLSTQQSYTAFVSTYQRKWYHLKWIISSDRTQVDFYINNEFIGRIKTNIPTDVTKMYSAVLGIYKTAGTGAKAVGVEMVKITTFYPERRLIVTTDAGYRGNTGAGENIENVGGEEISYPGGSDSPFIIQ